MCQRYGVSRSGFYAKQKRTEAARHGSDAAMIKLITQAHAASGDRYGSPRITKALRQYVHLVGRGRVARLMRKAAIQGRGNHLFRRKGKTLEFFSAVDNVVRGQDIQRIDQLWVGDVTYLKVAGQWRYLAVVMDRFSRRIIGWALGKRRTSSLTIAALQRAIHLRKSPAGVFFHSDRGAEYGSRLYKQALNKHGFIQSMNRPGSMNDNAHMESFFHTLKIEGLYKMHFDQDPPLRQSLRSYFSFYNEDRLHSALAYQPPGVFEKSHLTPTVH
jgi:transposase InsO family protein